MAVSAHLVIACGGTGGHFYPALSVARAWREMGGRVTLLVSGPHAQEQANIAAEWGLATRKISTVRRPSSLPGMLLMPFRWLKCCRLTKAVLSDIDGDLLLGMGSFAAAPPCWVWPWRKKPLVLHEGNTIMGRTNRIFVRRARAVALTLPLHDPSQLRGREGRITGMPLRDAVVNAAAAPVAASEREQILTEFGLSPAKKTMLVFGGSQGARAVNQLLMSSAPRLKDYADRLQFIILTGQEDNSALVSAFQDAGIAARIVRGDPEIQRCYQVSELILCRGGASSICELALYHKPLIIVPLPTAADNHQFYNAMALVQAGAARMLEQRLATPELLTSLVQEWLNGGEEWPQMGQHAQQFAHPDATARVAHLLAEIANG